MSRIDIETLTKRECDGIVVERRICRRIVCLDWGMREACDEFLDVPDTLDAGDGGTKCRIVPIVEKHDKHTRSVL